MVRLRETKIYKALLSDNLDEIANECVKHVKSGKNVNLLDEETGESYLHLLSDQVERFSSQRGVCIIYIMACKGIDLDIQDRQGDTFLHRIMRKPNTHRAVVAVIRLGADILVKNNEGLTPEDVLLTTKPDGWNETLHWFNKFKPGLYRALIDAKPNRALVEKLLKYLCRVNIVKKGEPVNLTTVAKQNIRDFDLVSLLEKYENTNEFALALLTGKEIVVRNFFKDNDQSAKANTDINVRDYSYQYRFPDYPDVPRPMLAAMWEGDMKENVAFLLEIGVDTSVLFTYYPGHDPPKPLFFQLVSGLLKPSDKIVHDILRCSDMTARSSIGQTILFEAIEQEYPESFIKRLFYYGVNIASRDKYGRTARDYARITNKHKYAGFIDEHVMQLVTNCNIEQVETLVIQGYDHLSDLVDSSGKAVLDIVKEGSSAQLYEVMKKVETVEMHIRSMFVKAKQGNLPELRKLLGKKYACALDRCGRTLLHVIVLNRHCQAVHFMIKNYSSLINMQDNLGRTSLHYAHLFIENDPAINMMVELGGDCQIEDVKGRTPSDYACERCGKRTFALLQKEVGEMMTEVFLYETNFEQSFVNAVKRGDKQNAIRLIRGLGAHGDINRYSSVLFTCIERGVENVAIALIKEGMRTDIFKQYQACDPNNPACAMCECSHTVTSFRERAEELQRTDVIGMLNELEGQVFQLAKPRAVMANIMGIDHMGTFANI